MASSYPASIPTYPARGVNMDDVPTHDSVHQQLQEDIQAGLTELGTNPSAAYATVAARLSALQSLADAYNVALDARIDPLEGRAFNATASTWQPGIFQPGAISATYGASWKMILGSATGSGGVFIAGTNLTIAGPGTSGASIVMNTPYTLAAADAIWAMGYVKLGGPTYVHLTAVGNDANGFFMVEHRENGGLGADPAFALGAGDQFSMFCAGIRA